MKFQKKALEKAFFCYIILPLRSAQRAVKQKVAGCHFRVISAEHRPKIGRSKLGKCRKTQAFALKNSYGTHGSVYRRQPGCTPFSGQTTTCGGKGGKAYQKLLCPMGEEEE